MRNTLFMLVLLFLLPGCEKENRWDCFKSYGDEITETRELPPFDAVYIEGKVDVAYRYSETYFAEVQFGENIVDLIKTEITDGALSISNDARCNWVRDLSKRPLVTLYAPTFSYMENRASGDITFRDTLKGESFFYEQWECNGEATLKVQNEQTSILLHVGYCNVTASGQTNEASLYTAAVGRLRARALTANITLSNNSSIQDVELYASEYLYAEINGSGSIRYDGNPPTVETIVNGSGSVVKF